MNEAVTGIAAYLSNFGDVLDRVIGTITSNTLLMTMFAGSLLAVGAKVFKKIKRAAK